MKKTIKKILAFIAILSLFSFNFSSIIFYTSYGLHQTNNILSDWISSKQLIKIILNKWFTNYWIKTFLNIREVTVNDIKNLRKKSKKEKILFIKKLFWIWLTNSQIEKIKKNNWFSKNWINFLNNFSTQNSKQNNLKTNNITNNIKNNSIWKNFINKNFLSNVKNWIYKINFTDIIPWKNAWIVQANFVWTKNFPKKIILEQGFSFDINQKNLDRNLKRTNELLNKINILKKQKINFWKLKITNSKLSVLPDRLRYTKEINIVFSTEKEYKNINKYLWEYFNPNKSKSTVKNNNLKNNSNYLKTSWNTKNLDYSIKNFWKNLIEECNKKTNNAPECKKLDIKNLEKTISFEEKIDFSLIPLSLEDIQNKNILINKDPKKIKITKKDIIKRFDLLKEINIKKDFWYLKNVEMSGEIPKHNMNNPKYCDIYYEQELKQAKHTNKNVKKIEEKIKKCKTLQKEVNKVTKASYKQNLLNWFTIWDSKSYSWSTSISVNTYIAWKIKIFEFSFNFYYFYWVWIRIPIVVEAEVKDSIVHDYETEKEKAKVDFETKIKLKTINGDSKYYKDIWIENKHIYDWKELVLKFGSGIKFHVRTPITGNIDYEIKLVSLLVEQIEKSLKKMISKEKIEEFKKNNIIDLSKDFIPPFAWNNLLNLLRLESEPIILFSVYWIDLLWKIWLKVDIDGRITAKCETVNAKWWCPKWDKSDNWVDVWVKETSINIWYDSSRIHFNNNWYYIWKWKAYFNWNNAQKDELSTYWNFWLKFNDFKYHPILLLTLYALVWVWIPDVPYIWDLVVWSPEIDIYTLKFSSDELYLKTHSWTKWEFDVSKKDKIYSTSSTLKEISSIWIIKKWKKITPRSGLIIKPDSNTTNWNSVFYRTNWTFPSCKIEKNTKLYFPWDIIYKEVKDELQNEKMINIKAIACDMFNIWDPRARKTYKKNILFKLKNYYHKPIIADLIVNSCVDPANTSDKTYKQNTSNWYNFSLNYFDSKISWLLQEEIDKLDFIVPRLNPIQKSFIQILAYKENSNYIIKYSFEDKNPKIQTTNNFSQIRLYNSSQNISIKNSDICNSNSWKIYKWEVFIAWEDPIKWIDIPDSYKNTLDKRIFYNTDKILKAVKCIKKADWTYFQSLMTIADIKVVNTTTACTNSSPIDQNWAKIHINEKMKKDLIDPISNIQNKFKTKLNINSFNKNLIH